MRMGTVKKMFGVVAKIWIIWHKYFDEIADNYIYYNIHGSWKMYSNGRYNFKTITKDVLKL